MTTRLAVVNQRGGVGKTTTAINLAAIAAKTGIPTLLLDGDPQGSIATVLGLAPKHFLYDFIIGGMVLEECVVEAQKNLHVLCSNRKTAQAEMALTGMLAREMVLKELLRQFDQQYGLVIVDVSPSISQIQTSALVYAENLLVPASMDILSFQGAGASIETAKNLNHLLRLDIRTVAILPVMVHRRMVMTELVMRGLEELGAQQSIPILPAIRTDTCVPKSVRSQKFLSDYDNTCKAYIDYREACSALMTLLHEGTHVE